MARLARDTATAASPPEPDSLGLAGRILPGGIFYGWYIAFAGAINNFFVLGVVIFAFGVFYEPMRDELGWSMAAITAGVSLRSSQQGLLSPLTGHLVDALGPRRMATTGITILTIGLIMFSQTHSLWVYYLSSVLIALGQSLGAFTPYSVALMNWFHVKRGRAMGIMNMGNGFGYFAVPIVSFMVVTFGWRETLIIVAVVIFVTGIPMGLLIKSTPEEYGYLPDGVKAAAGDDDAMTRSRAVSNAGLTVREAMRTDAFYFLVLTAAAGSATQITWVSLQVPHLRDVGFSSATVGLLITVYGIIQVALRFGCGWIGDWIGRKRMFMASFIFQAFGFVAFAFLTPDRLWLLPFYYVTFALGHAAWVVTSMTIAADYFGTKRYATISGLTQSLAMPASVIAPVFGGWWFDRTGSYQALWLLFAIVVASGCFWMSLIRRPLWGVAPRASPKSV